MGEEQIQKDFFTGRITSGIKPHTIQLSIINFIKQQLPLWRDDPERQNEESEPKLNPQLSKFLNTRTSGNIFPMIFFHHEEPQSDKRHVDISVSPEKEIIIEAQTYNKYEPVLVIECKRLPAPTAKTEKEYVSSQSTAGGIQRFKLGLHGAKYDLAVMIGYIQKFTSDYWLTKVNCWILELVKNPIGDGCVWGDDEILEESDINKSEDIRSYHSYHIRTCKKSTPIELHHLWISMNQGCK
ncbi:MAG: hypothetical protein JW787_01615 [Sedimentisphaerales bacterium]|nr:hypothetical protein [Sedimentisphaerales bacterium]